LPGDHCLPLDPEQLEIEHLETEVKRSRWTCSVCQEESRDKLDMRKFRLTCCKATVCCSCAMRAVTELQGRCPASADNHLMSELDVHAACKLDPRRLSKHFQHLAWMQAGRVGIKCGQDGCRGVVPPPQAGAWLLRPRALACPGEGCPMRYCGCCRQPWGAGDDHQCADLPTAGGGKIRFCPGCGVATERISGCNAMECGNPSCGSSWCWECGSHRETHGCGHGACRKPRGPQGRALGGAPAPPVHDAAAVRKVRLAALEKRGQRF